VLGFFGKIWNRVVKLAIDFVVGLVKLVTQPIVNLIVTVLTALETIRQLSTYLKEWRSAQEPKPETNRFGIDNEKMPGTLTLTVFDNRLPIPPEVLDCADLFDVDLRNAGSAAGSAVTWTPTNMGRADLSVRDSASAELDKDQKAEYHYFTGQESKKTAQGDEHAGLLKLVSSVHRNDIEKVRKLFTALVFDQIPSSIRGIVESIAGPILDAATSHLTSITDVRATGYVAITFHGEKPADPTPPPTAAAKTWQGQWQSSKYPDSGTFTMLIVIADGQLNGSIDIENSPCVSSGRVAGVVDAGSVSFGSVEAGNEVQYQGTISADGATMQGTYTDGDACGNDVGSWSARRTTP
jgi:hypothetical protein